MISKSLAAVVFLFGAWSIAIAQESPQPFKPTGVSESDLDQSLDESLRKLNATGILYKDGIRIEVAPMRRPPDYEYELDVRILKVFQVVGWKECSADQCPRFSIACNLSSPKLIAGVRKEVTAFLNCTKYSGRPSGGSLSFSRHIIFGEVQSVKEGWAQVNSDTIMPVASSELLAGVQEAIGILQRSARANGWK